MLVEFSLSSCIQNMTVYNAWIVYYYARTCSYPISSDKLWFPILRASDQHDMSFFPLQQHGLRSLRVTVPTLILIATTASRTRRDLSLYWRLLRLPRARTTQPPPMPPPYEELKCSPRCRRRIWRAEEESRKRECRWRSTRRHRNRNNYDGCEQPGHKLAKWYRLKLKLSSHFNKNATFLIDIDYIVMFIIKYTVGFVAHSHWKYHETLILGVHFLVGQGGISPGLRYILSASFGRG